MTAAKRIAILAALNRGEDWAGRINGRLVELTKHRRGWVEVWIPKRNGGATFRAATVTDAVREVQP